MSESAREPNLTVPNTAPHQEGGPTALLDGRPTPAQSETGQGAESAPDAAGYDFLGQVGHGGMGVVWRCRDRRLGRDVALKVLRQHLSGQPRLAVRFIEEAQVASQLQHPAIPPVHELGELPDGRPYFAMKLVQGHTLAELLQARSGPADDLARFLAIFEQVCQAVAYAHSKGVIHRDLKPANIMVGAFGEVQVMDWGLAKLLRPGGATAEPSVGTVATVRTTDADATQTGALLGTPAYMGPEQARGEVGRLDTRCDVFGLGAMLCEVLTGQPPYVGTFVEVKDRAERGEVGPALDRLGACGADGELVELARRCLSPDVEDRPADAGAVAASLTAYLTGVQERLRRAEVERAAAQARAVEERKRRRVALALAAAVVGLVAAAAGGGLLLQRQAAERARREGEQRQAVDSALERARGLREQTRWREAQVVLEQARQGLGEAAPGEVRQRLDAADAELALVNRLDTIRQRRATIVEGQFDYWTAERDYAAAFRDAGLGEVGDDPEAVAARVRASWAARPLVAALDEWASVTSVGDRRSWLLRVARRAAPDPWGDRFRDPAVWQDRQGLRALADEVLRDDGDKLNELSPQELVILGRLLRGGAEAVPLLRAAQRRHPNDFWVNLDLAGALSNTKQVAEAVGYSRVAVALRPDAAAAHNNLGKYLADSNDLDGAIVAFRQAIALDPGNATVHANLGNALRLKKDLDGAVAAYRKAIALNPDYAKAHAGLGHTLHDKKDRDGAVAEYKKAIDIDPKSAVAHQGLGAVLYDRHDLEGAMTEARQAIALDKNNAKAHYNLGVILHDKQNLGAAVAEYKKAIALDPKDAQAHYNLGTALNEQDDLSGAIAAYRQAIALAPKDGQAHNNLGTALRDKGDLDGAIVEYRQAVALDPKNAKAHYNLGNALADKKDLAGAIAEFKKAIEIADYPEAHCNLGHALRDQGHFAEALDELRRGDALGRGRLDWDYPSAEWVRTCEHFVELDRRLPAVRAGKAEPANVAERLALAQLCGQYKRLHATAVRLYAGAFAADPRLAADLRGQHRYNAACSAALAAAEQGDDAKRLPDKERRMLRRQALAWLRDDLALYAKLAERARPAARKAVRERMQQWQRDPDLAPVRSRDARNRLSDDERRQWRQFWVEVSVLLDTVEETR
jgi:tetratricopeptide (TPR) repeat protein/tRNA A-37 threonylcarbamoyl transferase component Bud32